MKIMVTGGTGVIGPSVVTALSKHGHAVRLFSRHATHEVLRWRHGVTAIDGDVTDPSSITGSADGCDAIVHLVAIIEETPPDETFQRVNVEGTRNVVREAERAGVARIVHVSSLGCDRGASPYHRSKRDAEEIIRGFAGEWIIMRPGTVYGPGDNQIAALLKMVRTLPAVPMIGDGSQLFQPVWHEDVAEAIAIAVDRDDLNHGEYNLAGDDVTSQHDLVERMRRLTNRPVMSLPIPELIAEIGLKAADVAGVDLGFSESQLRMLVEGNVIPADIDNALTRVFDITPMPLDNGLRLLAEVQPEQLPDRGVGPLTRKRYWADIRGGHFDAELLLDYVRDNFASLAPPTMSSVTDVGAPIRIEEGATLTLSLPLRGQAQVRVAEVDERRFTLITLDGHPLAGAVRIQTDALGDAVRFEVQGYDRAASLPDLMLMRTLGTPIQDRAWTEFIDNVVRASGGDAAGVQYSTESLGPSEARVVQRWAEELVLLRKQREAEL
jgi:uncharacterized protein YbjT (DUF2867 family)